MRFMYAEPAEHVHKLIWKCEVVCEWFLSVGSVYAKPDLWTGLFFKSEPGPSLES